MLLLWSALICEDAALDLAVQSGPHKLAVLIPGRPSALWLPGRDSGLLSTVEMNTILASCSTWGLSIRRRALQTFLSFKQDMREP